MELPRATTEVDAELLAPLLAELAAEPCGHSWRTLLAELAGAPSAELVDQLLARAQRFRPFTLFTWVAEGQAVAIGTVAERVHATFPHEGFPVIARCFVRRPWRGRGLYPHLVRQRIAHCHERWGDQLRAVHLGAADKPVLATVRQLEPAFVHVGDETLHVAGEAWRVRDYLAPTPRFRAELPDEPILRRFLDEGAAAVTYTELHAALGERSEPALRQLFDLLDAIGVQR